VLDSSELTASLHELVQENPPCTNFVVFDPTVGVP